jgi:alpha-beta hydrolase superfamily lysophospholipase
MNSHGGKSGYFGVNIAKNTQINVYSLDFLNFGKSQGDLRGYIHSFDECVNQAESFADHVSSLYNHTTPIFLCGMSLGGSISLKMSLRNPQKYKGIIFLNPALR